MSCSTTVVIKISEPSNGCTTDRKQWLPVRKPPLPLEFMPPAQPVPIAIPREGFVSRPPLPPEFSRSPLPTFTEALGPPVKVTQVPPGLDRIPPQPEPLEPVSRALVDALAQPFMDAYHVWTGQMTEQEQKDFALNAAMRLLPFGRVRPYFAPARGGGSGGRVGSGSVRLPADRLRVAGKSRESFGSH
jgi:hypothetical protein